MPYQAPTAAKPTKSIFDPFNSSATGHQRADSRLGGSISWRQSRNLKLSQQFKGGSGGGKRVSDTVGAGSLEFGKDGRTENGAWERGAKGLRTGGQRSLWETMRVAKNSSEGERPAKRMKVEGVEAESCPTIVVNPFTPLKDKNGTVRESIGTSHECSPSDFLEPIDPTCTPRQSPPPDEATEQRHDLSPEKPPPPQIFTNLYFYINGCTAPISDHKLKHLLSTHGGNVSISLGRRTVTHVILSKTNVSGGCGGGLAGTKIQREISSLRGKSVKFVTSEWVVESIKAGKRLPESRFEAMRLAPKGVANISTMFKPK